MYLTLKLVHIACAALSIAGFVFRGTLRLRGSQLLEHKFLKIAPHVVDTVLILSAAGLVVTIHQYPFVDAWLTAKVLGLMLYIALGLVTMRFARAQMVRVLAFVAAITVFAYIVSVAVTHSPLPFG